jgi:hypothetical protein
MSLTKIISGGQTGAEIAGIDAAIENGLPYGGWLPEGRRTENGPLDSKYTNMMELEDADYPDKTEQNVKDADGTAIFSHGKLTGDASLAHGFARIHNKPVLHLDMNELSETEAIESSIEWIYRNKIEILNVTGSPESKDEYIYDDVHSTIKSIITTIKTAEIFHAQRPSSRKPAEHKAVFAKTPQAEITMAETDNISPDVAEEEEPVPSPVEYFPGVRRKSFLYIASGILVLVLVLFVIARMHHSSGTMDTKPRSSSEDQVVKTTGSSNQSLPAQAATAEPQKVTSPPVPIDSSGRPGVQSASSETAMDEGARAKTVENKTQAAADGAPLAAKPQETVINENKKEHEDGAVTGTSPDYGEKHGVAQSLSDTSKEDIKIETNQVAAKKVTPKIRYSCGTLYRKISLGQVLDKAESDFLAKNCH